MASKTDSTPVTASTAVDDPLVEIKPNYVMKKSEINDDHIRSLNVKCTACAKGLISHSKKIRQHAHLKVLICDECEDFYSSGEFSQDEDGDKYCRWCANGGKLYGCDFCTNSFCIACIRRNFGRGEVTDIKDKDWKCYSCDSSKLEQKVAYCDLIIEYAKDRSRWTTKKSSTSNSSVLYEEFENEGYLESFFEKAEAMSSKFQERISKLKGMYKKKSKSEKHILEKLVQVSEAHKTEVKKVTTKCYQYSQYVKKKPMKFKSENHTEHDHKGSKKAENISLDISGFSSPDDSLNISVEAENDASNSSNEKECNESTPSKDITELLSDDTSKQKEEAEIESNSLSKDMPDKSSEISEKEKAKIESNNLPKDMPDKSSEINEKESDSTSVQDTVNDSVNNSAEKSKTSEEVPNIKPSGFLSLIKSTLFDDTESEGSDSSFNIADGPKGSDSDPSNENKPKKKKSHKKVSVDDCLLVLEKDESILDADAVSEKDALKSNLKTDSNKDFDKTPKKKESKKVILSESDSSSSIELGSSSESEGKKKVKKTVRKKKLVNGRTKPLKKQMTMEELLNDSKLKLKAYVLVDKMDFSICKEIEKCLRPIPSPDSDFKDDDLKKDEIDKTIDKTIDALTRIPKRKKTTSSEDDNEEDIEEEEEINKEKTKKEKTEMKAENPKLSKSKKKIEEKDSSSEITFSSSEGEDPEEKDMSEKNAANQGGGDDDDDANLLAKKDLLTKISSSDESSLSSTEPEEAPKSKKKQGKKDSNSSSSDDFQPRKKTKYDKLLRESTALSDDEKKEPKKKIERKKKTKRKIFSSDEKSSNATTSDDSSDSDNKKGKGKAKKRKRIKTVSDSDEDKKDKDSDVEVIGSQDTPGKGRKNIRKVLSKAKLTADTKEAQLAEKERRRRLQERQKLYNKITDTAEDGSLITRKMVLEVDPVSKEEIVEIPTDIVEFLKPHQINGVKFMWECTIESLKELETKPGSGCILAHCMGLGKTLQVIAFLYTCLTNKYVSKKIKRAMVICPYNTVLNWENEFDIWLQKAEDEILLHQISNGRDNDTRLDILNYWVKEGGVIIIGYDIFRRLMEGKMQKFPKQKKQKLYDILTTGADIVVCDEGHILKNEQSAISKAANKIKTQRRIVLTGTPLQNNLKEYHCMVQFVKPNLLGNSKEFRNRFVNPITNGQYDDSSQRDVKLMKKRVHILHKLLEGCVQRCDYSTLTKFLPPKHEFVISVKLSEVQIKMYRYYLDQISDSKNNQTGKIEGRTLFSDYNSLKNIWTFPFICHTSFERSEERRSKLIDSEEEGFIDDASFESSGSSPESVPPSGDEIDLENPKAGTSKKRNDGSSDEEVVKVYKTRSRATAKREQGEPESEEEKEEEKEEIKQWYHEFISEADKFNLTLSGKIVLLLDILKECEAIGDKIIVFSQSLLTLDMIEDILGYMADQPLTDDDKVRDVIGTWTKGVDYFRMDGSTSADLRKKWIETFNNINNERARLFLISTKAGSLGTNLIGANRVVLLDASWNPSHDVQAIFRVYRFGQKKPVYIYRLLAQGTMEEKIYDRQVTKLSLSIRVVDEQQIDRHFNAAQLAELYNFEPESTSDRPTPMVPNDRLLAEMLIRNKDWIVNYHEHDSLLQNKTEEDLTEEERQSAWNEYENEKEGLFNTFDDSSINAELYEQLNADPDFSKDEFAEIKVPDVNLAVKLVSENINKSYPNENANERGKRLFDSLCQLRQIYQAKHVKMLRLKQEYFTRGIIQPAMNKYLDEVGKALKSLTVYITTLHTQMENIKKAAFQQAYARMAAQQANKGAANFMPNNSAQFPRQAMPNPGYYYASRRGGVNVAPNVGIQNINPSYTYVDMESGTVYASIPRGAKVPTTSNQNTHSRNASESQPLITEVELEDEPSLPDSTVNTEKNSSSSVVITEIE